MRPRSAGRCGDLHDRERLQQASAQKVQGEPGAGHVGDKQVHDMLVAAVAVERPEDGQRPDRAQAGQQLRPTLPLGGGPGSAGSREVKIAKASAMAGGSNRKR
jgi:hypothetical protein